MKRICEWAMALLFSGVLLVLMAATILLPKNRYSYYENRNLSAFPEITAESVLSGQVFDDLETLFCDYAAWRTPALKAVTWADLNVFRRPVVNETVVTDDVLLPQLYDPAMSDDDIRAQAKLVAEDNAALQKQVESYGGHYCYVAVPCQYVYYEDSYPAYLTNRSHYTDLELSALTEEMNAQGVCFLDMGPVFDSLGHPPEFSSRVDNHYGLLGAYETYRAAVQKINGDYGLALSFPEEGTDVTFSALPNPYMGSRTRKLLGLRGDDEKLLTAAFREDIPFTRLDNWQEVASAVYDLPATEDEALTYGLYMGGDIAETCIRTDRPLAPHRPHLRRQLHQCRGEPRLLQLRRDALCRPAAL